MSRIVRFGAGAIGALSQVADELGLERLLLVTSLRGAELAPELPVVSTYAGVRSHVPGDTVGEVAQAAEGARADGFVALGGGSAIDTCKAATLELRERGHSTRTIAVPTTYAGAEWTPFFGVRDEAERTKSGGSHDAARPVAALYDPELTLALPRSTSGGTAMNALAHCAEAFYARGRNGRGDRHAFCGARTISYALPLVLADGSSLYARTRLLEGAMRSALALAEAGLALGHALAQALGARFGLPHGALNAICLPSALRFNEPAIPDALARLGEAMATDDPIGRVKELAELAGFSRLRDLGVLPDELDEVAALAVDRPGARANPRLASHREVVSLLESIW